MVDLALKLKVFRLLFFNFVPTGRGKQITGSDLTPQQRKELLEYICRKRDELMGKLDFFSTDPCFAAALVRHKKDMFVEHTAKFLGGCAAGRVYCSITAEGKVKPCVFMPIIVGDLRKQSFEDIWNNSEVMKNLRDWSKRNEKCRECKYNTICGGCRSRAYGYTGNYLGDDPLCPYSSELWPKEKDIKE